jgi:NAD(P)-dependent dehydrogenase (short-subunit alcohol dehydrogenase family)
VGVKPARERGVFGVAAAADLVAQIDPGLVAGVGERDADTGSPSNAPREGTVARRTACPAGTAPLAWASGAVPVAWLVHHATKHGVLGLTRSAALEYAPRGIRVNAVCPGTIETPMVADMIAKGELTVADAEAGQPIGRLGRGDEIAAAVLWLCSPGASLVVGVALPVDGGYTAR